MTRARFGWRLAMPLTVVLLAVGTIAACGATVGSPTGGTAESGAATIAHEFGQTVVPANPKRVVTVGWNDQDFVLALGVVPVAVRSFDARYDDLPWVRRATGGKPIPTWGADNIDVDAIAKEKPDVIFAIHETIDEPTYAKLSKIAPTVVQSKAYADEETPWDVQQLITGKALGKELQAHALVDDVHKRIDAARRANPEFAGKVLVDDFGPESGGHYLLGAKDPRRALFNALGFGTQEATGDLGKDGFDRLDRDVLFVDGATARQMLASPVFARLPVVAQGRALYTSFDSNLSAALFFSGPEALKYGLDELVPQLGNALNGRPVADLSQA